MTLRIVGDARKNKGLYRQPPNGVSRVLVADSRGVLVRLVLWRNCLPIDTEGTFLIIQFKYMREVNCGRLGLHTESWITYPE